MISDFTIFDQLSAQLAEMSRPKKNFSKPPTDLHLDDLEYEVSEENNEGNNVPVETAKGDDEDSALCDNSNWIKDFLDIT